MPKGWYESADIILGKARHHSEVAKKRKYKNTLRSSINREPWQMSLEEYIYGNYQLSKYDRKKWKEQFNMSYPASGRVKIYRGAWQQERKHLSPGDWVTLDKKFARNYAGKGGKIFEMEVPISELYHNITTSMPGKSELIWKPEASLQRVDKHGNYMLLADYHRQEIMKAIRDGRLKYHPDYPEFDKKVVEG